MKFYKFIPRSFNSLRTLKIYLDDKRKKEFFLSMNLSACKFIFNEEQIKLLYKGNIYLFTQRSFEQLCKLLAYPHGLLNKLSSELVANIFTELAIVRAKKLLQRYFKILALDALEYNIIRCITSLRYKRCWNKTLLNSFLKASFSSIIFDFATVSDDLFQLYSHSSKKICVNQLHIHKSTLLWNSEIGESTLGVRQLYYIPSQYTHLAWQGLQKDSLINTHCGTSEKRQFNINASIKLIKTLSTVSIKEEEYIQRCVQVFIDTPHTFLTAKEKAIITAQHPTKMITSVFDAALFLSKQTNKISKYAKATIWNNRATDLLNRCLGVYINNENSSVVR